MKKEKGTFGWVFTFAGHKKSGYIASVILAVIGAAFQLLPFFVMAQVIGKLLAGDKDLAGYLIDCAVMAVLWLLRVLFHSLSTAQSHKATFAVLGNIRKQGLAKLAKMPLGDVQSKGSGELKNILVERVDSIEPTLAHAIPEMSSNAAVALATLIYLFVIDWRMALASLITFPLGMVFFMLMMAGYNKNYARTVAATNTLNDTAVEYIGGIEVIKAFGRAGVSYEKYAKAITDFRTFVVKWLSSTWVTMKLAFALFPSTLLGTLPVSLYLADRGSITGAQAALAVMLSMSMVGSLAKLEGFSENTRQMKMTVEQLDAYLTMPNLPEPECETTIKHHDVELKNVHFSYSGEKKDEVLHGIDLTLPEGSYTALVGPSGGGKSTVAKLIARFWDVTEGTICIGGVDIRRISVGQLAEHVSFVTQDNFLFRCSILENIRLGNPAASDEEVKAAARAAQCEEFILKLPQGYDTPAGEAGKRLSGGEKQRVAIARMMLKNAPIVILDEATAFTDPENEEKLQQSIAALTKGKTLLVIAHRLSTIQTADQIVVLQAGEILAKGTQEELLVNCPLYQKMWKLHIGAKHWAVSQGRKEDVSYV